MTYAYVLHAFNGRGEQLHYHTYGSEYEPEFARSNEYETVRWTMGRTAGIASGYVLRYPRYASATGVAGAWKRNRIAYFEVRHNGDLIARYMREQDGTVRMFVIGIDGAPLSGYSVFREGSGYTVRFNGEPLMHNGAPIGPWGDARAAFAACRRHADGGYLPGDMPDSQHRVGFSTVGTRFDISADATRDAIMAQSVTEPLSSEAGTSAPDDASAPLSDPVRAAVDHDTRDYWRRELSGLGVTSERYRVKFTSDTGVTKWLSLPAAVFNAIHDVMTGE